MQLFRNIKDGRLYTGAKHRGVCRSMDCGDTWFKDYFTGERVKMSKTGKFAEKNFKPVYVTGRTREIL